jgi:tetratricopeptide (TPR) repeat protein
MLNKDDNELLEFWAEQTFDDYFEYITGIKTNELKTVDLDEAFDNLLDKFDAEYDAILLSHIQYCEGLLKSTPDKRLYFILARLYDKHMVEGNLDHLYKRTVRYYAIKAIRADRSLHKAWCLLGKSYSFVALLGGNEKVRIADITIKNDRYKPDKAKTGYKIEDVKKNVHFYEKAIFCFQQAVKIFPQNPTYKDELKKLYCMRNGSYKCLPKDNNGDF